MKTIILTIATMFMVAWALNKPVAPAPDNLLPMNVEALADPGGGADVGKPEEQPLRECIKEVDYNEVNNIPFRKCKNDDPQRAGRSQCVNNFTLHSPRAIDFCLALGELIDPQ